MSAASNEVQSVKLKDKTQFIVYNLPKKSDAYLCSAIQAIIEFHYGLASEPVIRNKSYGCMSVKYALLKLSSTDPYLKKINGRTLDGNHLLVCSKNIFESCYHDLKTSSIWIYKLPKEATEEDVWRFFESCGRIISLYIIRDGKRGTSVQSFVQFEDNQGLLQGLKLDKQPFLSGFIRVKEFNVRGGLFVSGLQANTKQADLETFFQHLHPMHLCFPAEIHSAHRVYFAEESHYGKALALNRRSLNEVSLIITGSDANSVTRNLYVTNLPGGTSVFDLKSVFDWNIKSMKKCNYGITKLTFENETKAKAALRVVNPVIHSACITLYSDFAQASHAVLSGSDGINTNPVIKTGDNKNVDNNGHSESTEESFNTTTGLLSNSADRHTSQNSKDSMSPLPKKMKRQNGTIINNNKAKSPKLDKVLHSVMRPRARVKKIIMKKKKEWSVSSL